MFVTRHNVLTMKSVNSLVLLTLLSASFLTGQLYNECSLKNGSNGICELIPECPQVTDDILKEIYPPQCTFKDTHTIVCCSQIKPAIKPQPLPIVPLEVKPNPTTPTNGFTRLPGVISNKRCLEYSEDIWKLKENHTSEGCPLKRRKRIVGGSLTSRTEFPHMVQIGHEASDGVAWVCGGSLISPQFILTAAICLNSPSYGVAKYVRMGLVDLEDDEHMQKFKIAERIPHPQHKFSSKYHDIGLVKLEGEAKLNMWVRPACLYTKKSSPQSNVIATGWGNTDIAGEKSKVLLKVILELYDHPNCNNSYKNVVGRNLEQGVRDDIMICAGHSMGNKDTCNGDSGGPLMIYRNGKNEFLCMYEIVGITSFGKGCGLANVPAIYTRVSYYTKWIEDIVWPQMEDFIVWA